ncbi:MAG: hypothetical protein ACI8P3_002301 [Saprospiraceae bacterium]|jgi:hypothetical protein
MKIDNIFFLLFMILGVFTCATTSPITSDYEMDVDLSGFKTFRLLEHKDGFSYGINPVNQKRIEGAIQREMLMLGYKISPDPDLLVAYFVKEKLVEEAETNYQGYYKKLGFPLWENIIEYKEGTLIIDLIDRSTQQVVWHGAFNGKMSDDMANVEDKINDIVQALFEQFNEDTYSFRKVTIAD